MFNPNFYNPYMAGASQTPYNASNAPAIASVEAVVQPRSTKTRSVKNMTVTAQNVTVAKEDKANE